jgi:hypothetical protein
VYRAILQPRRIGPIASFREALRHRQNQLRRAVFRSVPELVSTIEQYVERHNRDPKPFIWTAKASDILAKVTRARAKLNKM